MVARSWLFCGRQVQGDDVGREGWITMESGGGQLRGGGFVAGGNGVEVGGRGERGEGGGAGVARAVGACGSCASAIFTTGFPYVFLTHFTW